MGKLVLVLTIIALTTGFNNAASIKLAKKLEDSNQPLYKLAAVLPELEEHEGKKDARPRDRNLLRTMLIDEYPDFELGEYGDEALQKFASVLEKMNHEKRAHFHSELKDVLTGGKNWRGDETSQKDASVDKPHTTNLWRGDAPSSSIKWRGDAPSSSIKWRGDQTSLKDAKPSTSDKWRGDQASPGWRGDQGLMSVLSDQVSTKDAMKHPRHRSAYRVIRDDEKSKPYPGNLSWFRGDDASPLLHRGDQKESPNTKNWRGDEKTKKLNALFENLLEAYERDMTNKKQVIPNWRGDEKTEH